MAEQVHAAQSITEYCSQYISTDKDACKDGVKGTDCGAYLIVVDDSAAAQRANTICKQAAKDRAAGIVSATTSSSPTPTPTPSTTPPSPSPTPSSSPSNSDSGGIQDLINNASNLNLSQYIDLLHDNGPDKEKDISKSGIPDNERDYYVNGAGKKQAIKVLNTGTGSSPAILFFNGGGWHQNDHVSDKVGGNLDNDGAEKAYSRGYVSIDVTYRLGSSGVYYMFEDVMRGVKHVRDNAKLYGIDPNKIAIWGDSAGGSLSMRAAASGKTGAKAAVGWSAPTNGYTALFKSIASLAIGMDHSTCIPTDLAGFANFADLVNGGSGDVAEYGQGLSSNDVSALGIDLSPGNLGPISFSGSNIDPLALLTQGLVAGKNLLSTAKNVESISNQIGNKNIAGLAGSTLNLASKKFAECIDNFNALSPALFASPDSTPSFLGEFENDGLIDPQQSYDMRDKLRQLGIKSEVLILPGSDDCLQKAPDIYGTGCHLGYYKDFVCLSLNFLDSIIQPERGQTNCGTGYTEGGVGTATGSVSSGSDGSNDGGSGSGNGSGGGSGGGGSNSNGGQAQNTDNPSTIEKQQAACVSQGYTWKSITKGAGYCLKPTQQEIKAGFYVAVYVKAGDTGHYTCPKGGEFTQDYQKGNICKL